MKRFFVMILCVSTFFIGLGGIVDRAGAAFQSDARALELIKQSRIAIGGDANINNVRSMTILGTSTHIFEKDGLQQSKQGEMEINMQLPGQFSKTMKFGNGGAGAMHGEHIEKSVDIVVMNGDSDDVKFTSKGSGEGDKNVFVIRKDDGTETTWTTDEGDQLKPEGNKIIIKKPDGTTEELNADDKHNVFVRKHPGEGETNVWNTDDGREVIIERIEGPDHGLNFRENEMLRMTLGLILTAPEGLDVSYKYLGESSVDGNPSNIIGVQSNGSVFKLFLDKSTYLPQMISFESRNSPKMVRFHKENGKDMSKEEIIELKTDLANAEMVEHQIKFSAYRSVAGLLLPHRWTQTIGGKQNQTFEVTSFEINPANIADKFKHRIRQEKP